MTSRPQDIPFSQLGTRLRPPAIAALMNTALADPGMLSLAAGFTDTATLPAAEVGAAVAALVARQGPPEFLQYGANRGRESLRRQLAARTAALDGLPAGAVDPERTLIGNGSQQLLHLAIEVLADPGDIVLVERPTYFVFMEMLAGLGVEAIGLPAAADGSLDLPACAELIASLGASPRRGRVKALYLMSYFGNPSGISRTEAEKLALAGMLGRAGLVVPVLEDAAYRDLGFGGAWPARSVLALGEFAAFPRLYLGTLTKPFATGMKIGYAHATDQAWFDRMCWLKGHQDFGSANFTQAILEGVIESGALDRHIAGLRATYAAKMCALDAALEVGGLRALGWSWTRPAGGLYLWLRAPEGVDTSGDGSFWRACMHEHMLYVPGGLCLPSPVDQRFVRLSFGVLAGEALAEAAARFCRAAKSMAAG
jgi:2-aminoadipate transaminase